MLDEVDERVDSATPSVGRRYAKASSSNAETKARGEQAKRNLRLISNPKINGK